MPPGREGGEVGDSMSLGGQRTRLMGITKELALHWEETKNHWRDAKCEEFERRYLQELMARMDKTIGVISKLDELLNKVRNDCE
jgi:hypothetical protein